jgi:decaprenylphospho-beta-D-ribofuranose 2-oxidase
VTFKLIPIQNPLVKVTHHAAANLEQLFKLMQDPANDDCYSVAWLDSLASGEDLGRGIAMCGHHATAEEAPDILHRPGKPRRSHSIPVACRRPRTVCRQCAGTDTDAGWVRTRDDQQ